MNTSRSKAIERWTNEPANERKKTNRIGLFSFKIETNDNDSDTAAKTKDAGASSLTLAVVVYPFRHSCFHFHYISVWFSLNSTLKILCVYAHIVHSAAQHTYIYVLKCNYFCSNWCTIHQLLRPRRFSFRKLFPCCHSWQLRFTATLLMPLLLHSCFANYTLTCFVQFQAFIRYPFGVFFSVPFWPTFSPHMFNNFCAWEWICAQAEQSIVPSVCVLWVPSNSCERMCVRERNFKVWLLIIE